MKIMGGNRFALAADDNEIATVTVNCTGTAFLVAYQVIGGQVLNGPNQGSMKEGTPLRFRLDKATPMNKLNLGFTFASPAAGDEDIVEYDIEVTGLALVPTSRGNSWMAPLEYLLTTDNGDFLSVSVCEPSEEIRNEAPNSEDADCSQLAVQCCQHSWTTDRRLTNSKRRYSDWRKSSEIRQRRRK